MAFYTFSQNNSGGYFIINKYLSQYVIIEANSADEANSKAKGIGVYFNGVEEGTDCDCCGDRWIEVYEGSACDTPLIYEIPAGEYTRAYKEGSYCIIHFTNGTIVNLSSKGK